MEEYLVMAVDLLRVFALAVGSLVIFAGVWHGALAARGPGDGPPAGCWITRPSALTSSSVPLC
jgi:hypothetical protein